MKGLATLAAGILSAVFSALSPGMASAERRVALVIGNAQYEHATKLANPGNDAPDIAAALKAIGFEVIEKTDLTKQGMNDALDAFERKSKGADAALFYYAGHGLQFQGQNFLLPVDVDLEDEVSLKRQTTKVEDVTSALDQAKLKILILDACRNNPFADRLVRMAGLTRAAGQARGLAPLDKQQTNGMIVAYATKANEVAQDGVGRNSPFTSALISQLKEKDLEVGLLFRRVIRDVVEKTAGKQNPEISITLGDEYILNPLSQDSRFWEVVRNSNSAADFEEFIRRFPDSSHVFDARRKLDSFESVKRMLAENAVREAGDAARLAAQAEARAGQFVLTQPDQDIKDGAARAKEAARLAKAKAVEAEQLFQQRDYAKAQDAAVLAKDAGQRASESAWTVVQLAVQRAQDKPASAPSANPSAAPATTLGLLASAPPQLAANPGAGASAAPPASAFQPSVLSAGAGSGASAVAPAVPVPAIGPGAGASLPAPPAFAPPPPPAEPSGAAASLPAPTAAAPAPPNCDDERGRADDLIAKADRRELETLRRQGKCRDVAERIGAELARLKSEDICREESAKLDQLVARAGRRDIEAMRRQSRCPRLSDRLQAELTKIEAAETCRREAGLAGKLDSANLGALTRARESFACPEQQAALRQRIDALQAEALRQAAACDSENAKLRELIGLGRSALADLKQLQAALTCEALQPSLKAAILAAEPPVDTPELIAAAQTELTRMNCYKGGVTGALDKATRRSLGNYAVRLGRPAQDVSVTEDIIEEMRKQSDELCPAPVNPPVAKATPPQVEPESPHSAAVPPRRQARPERDRGRALQANDRPRAVPAARAPAAPRPAPVEAAAKPAPRPLSPIATPNIRIIGGSF